MRLLFASLVIVSHTPELVDGDQSRELLTRLTGTASFGEVAVNGFFVISGFLITGSYANAASLATYLGRRVARIYPAFIVASLFCLLVAGQLGGGYFHDGPVETVLAAATRLLVLARPAMAGAFADQHHSDYDTALNGAMWTLQYEFLCYLIILPLVRAGALRRPGLLPLLAGICLIAAELIRESAMLPVSGPAMLPAPAAALPRLVGMFLAGASFYAWRDRMKFRPWMIGCAAIGLAATMSMAPLTSPGFGVFGGYLILAVGELASGTRLARINNRNDISYGLYLYAWPVQRLFMTYLPGLGLVALAVSTWVVAALLGACSWFVVEQPIMRWAGRKLHGRKGVFPHAGGS